MLTEWRPLPRASSPQHNSCFGSRPTQCGERRLRGDTARRRAALPRAPKTWVSPRCGMRCRLRRPCESSSRTPECAGKGGSTCPAGPRSWPMVSFIATWSNASKTWLGSISFGGVWSASSRSNKTVTKPSRSEALAVCQLGAACLPATTCSIHARLKALRDPSKSPEFGAKNSAEAARSTA